MSIASPRGEIVQQTRDPSRSMFVWITQISDLINALTSSGTTADRPTRGLFVGRTYFDSTIGKPIFYNGTIWVLATGVAA